MLTKSILQPASLQCDPVSDDRPFASCLVTLATAFAFAVHGYHPFSEDGGLYVSGIKRLLDPSLYSYSAPFVEAHLRFSLFAPMVAGLVRTTRLGLPAVLLLLHLLTLWTTLFAVWLLAARCYPGRVARAGAVALMAAWLTVPVAGTSLILMDPYLTARSISLPCTLLAFAGLLDLFIAETPRQRGSAAVLCGAPLLLAATVHPLMAGYGVGDLLLLAALLSANRFLQVWGTLFLCVLALGVAAILHALAPPETAAYLQVAISRYYWFLSRWHWYELLGLVAPLLILAGIAFRTNARVSHRPSPDVNRQTLTRMAITSGIIAIVVALAFAHERSATHLVGRLQPLRVFPVIYVLMILVLGAWLGEHVLRRSVWRWIVVFTLFGCLMFFVQRSTYPSSNHIEWPGAVPINRWEQAFLWISRNTPKDALFALDADYTASHGEDAQGFRAIAERSALPDYSKDGGEASITPVLTDTWAIGQRAQLRLSQGSDADRLAALQPLNVGWVVLLHDAHTNCPCPYGNELVKVCHLP